MKIKVVRVAQHCWIERLYSWMIPPLTMHLVDNSPQVDANGKRIKGNRKYDKAAYWMDTDGSVLFLAGLFEDFKKAATKQGVEVEYIEGRKNNPMTLVPNFENLNADLRYKQEEVIKSIVASDKGIIKCTVGFGKSFIIKLLCMIYPEARIVVISKARLVVDQLYKDISDTLGKAAVGKLCAGTPSVEETKRVVISTQNSATRAPLKKCDFLFFDEVHNVGDNQIYDILRSEVGNARMFGFTASLARGDGALGLIKGLFGKVIAECNYQEAQQHGMVVPIKAIMPMYDHRPITKLTDIQVINERIHYWQNWQRNAFIADVAADTDPDIQTVITVKTLEHAIFLHNQEALKNWPIIHAGNVDRGKIIKVTYTLETAPEDITAYYREDMSERHLVLFRGDSRNYPGYKDGNKLISFLEAERQYVDKDGQPLRHTYMKPVIIGGHDVKEFALKKKEVNALVESFAKGELKKAIATTVIKEGINLKYLKVLIRADGAVSQVFNTQVPGRLSRLAEGKTKTLLIDPFDNDNEWVLGRTMARRKLYKDQGWME